METNKIYIYIYIIIYSLYIDTNLEYYFEKELNFNSVITTLWHAMFN